MADSQLEAIFDAVANLSITIDGVAVTGATLANTDVVVNTTPARIISPLSDKNEGKSFESITVGKQFGGIWTITDLMLFRETEDGTGLEYNMLHLVRYMADYVDTIRANRKLGLSHVTIEKVDVQIGTFPYPVVSNDWYHGVKCELTIREIIG